MKTENVPTPGSGERDPREILQRLVEVFAGKGWLNQTVRIVHQERRYRIFCSANQFIAQRINDRLDVSWGFAAWPVCMITPDHIVEDTHLSPSASAEPSADEWFRCVAQGDFTLL